MRVIELSCGPIEYLDTGGDGRSIVLLHGLTMDGRLWEPVIERLAPHFRCLAPTMPEGVHRLAVRADYDLSPGAVSALIGEFIDALGLDAPLLVENDSGRAQQFAADHPERLGGLVIASCEALDNFPPGLPGRLAVAAARTPGGIWALSQLLRMGAVRHSRLAYGAMSTGGLSDDLLVSWLDPLRRSRAIRRDFAAYLSSVETGTMLVTAEGLRSLACPALVLWGADDGLMPRSSGERLAEMIPSATFELIEGSGTLIPLDRPAICADRIRRFVEDRVESRGPAAHAPSERLALRPSPPTGHPSGIPNTAVDGQSG